MPIYEYECAACGAKHDFIQKFSDGPKRKCPSCGKLRLKKQISAAAFHLKGDGWYVTDFRDKGKGKGKADSAESAGDSEAGCEAFGLEVFRFEILRFQDTRLEGRQQGEDGRRRIRRLVAGRLSGPLPGRPWLRSRQPDRTGRGQAAPALLRYAAARGRPPSGPEQAADRRPLPHCGAAGVHGSACFFSSRLSWWYPSPSARAVSR